MMYEGQRQIYVTSRAGRGQYWDSISGTCLKDSLLRSDMPIETHTNDLAGLIAARNIVVLTKKHVQTIIAIRIEDL